MDRISAINGAIRNQSRSDTTLSQESLLEIINECLVIVGARLKEIRVEVICDTSIKVEVFRSQFGQVLMNLLANAADAIMEESDRRGELGQEFKGHIRLTARLTDEQGLKLALEDTDLESLLS